jgi:L-ascorbate 6-phosphate lactonase
MSLANIEQNVPQNAIAIWWLGQAGFALKSAAGTTVYVDPYLSDVAERLFGFKRLAYPPIDAEEVRTDWLVLTHEHADHLDPDAVPVFVRNNPKCRFAAPEGCLQGLADAGAARASCVTLEPGKRHALEGLTIEAVPADHGDLSLSALCLSLEIDGFRLLFTGDTCLRMETLKPLYTPSPDVLLPCINGTFGNMNHLDAAMLVQAAQPRYAIPCHFWTFAEHGPADPGGFVHACRCFCPEVEALLLRPGERFLCERISP